jgi:hypothetical protein
VAAQNQQARRVEKVGRYLILWEVDAARVPVDAKERGSAWLAMVEMVKADMKKGLTNDWGAFAGELKGYAVDEGTEVAIMVELMKYAPYVKFEVHAIGTVGQVEEAIKGSMK